MLPACAMLPASATAQDYVTFVVVRSLKDYKDYEVFSAECVDFNVKETTKPQKATCIMKVNACPPGNCKFDVKSTDLPPLSLTFGISAYNPTCGWVWDWVRQRYIFYPC
jgi:hypothetical protein